MKKRNRYKLKRFKRSGNAYKAEKTMEFRMYIIVFICFIGFAVVLSRAVYLHLSDNDQLKWIANKQYNAKIPLSLRRGKIFDRNGEELAVSLPVPSIYVDPALVEEKERTAKELSSILKLDEKDVLKKMNPNRRFAWIKRRVSYDTLKQILSLNLPGVNYTEESRRFYPNSELASQVLGAVGYDSQALAGIEMAYDDVLKSKKKSTTYKRDARGKMYTTPLSFSEQSDVGDIYLTIDKQIQFFTENALRSAVEKYNAKDGVAVVLDTETGDILAMANSSVFDPNRYSKYPVSNWRNRAVTDAFEPGSTFKVLVIASALDEGVVNAETIFDCENGSVRIGPDTLRDHHPYGDLSVQDIVKYSSNIGSMKVAYELGREKFAEKLAEFGIGSATGIDYPGEVGGILRGPKTWQPVEYATVAFGQGLTTTPIQMAASFNAVVNGGIYFRPRLVSRIIGRDGEIVSNQKSEIVVHPIRSDVSETMRYLLKRVVEEGGTGTNAYSEAYSIGGKTGTAQKVSRGYKGYAKGKYFSSFVGFAPVEKPRLVVFVGIDEPKGSYYGGTVAAPAVREIAERSLRYLGVMPKKSPVMFMAKKEPETLGRISNKIAAEYEPPTTNKAKFAKIDSKNFVMPDLRGLTMREVLASTSKVDLLPEVEGVGVAVHQVPEPGSLVKESEKFSVKFELPR